MKQKCLSTAKRFFRFVAYAAVILLISLATKSIVEAGFNLFRGATAMSLSRAIVPSPNNKWLAIRSEYWDGDERIRTMSAHNVENGIWYSLTPEYLEIIEGPDPSVIAYIAADSSTIWRSVEVYVEDGKDAVTIDGENIKIHHPYSVAEKSVRHFKKDLVFSSDGSYLRFQSELIKDKDPLNPFHYKYRTLNKGEWDVRWTDEDFKHVQWLPPKKPSKLPDFMTDRTPRIHAKTIPVWSPKSDAVYVHDEEGIWRVNLLMPRMQVWKLFLPMKGVQAFRISSDGGRLIADIEAEGEEPNVVLVNLEGEDRSPRRLGAGWGGTFSPDGRKYAFAHTDGVYIGDAAEGGAKLAEAPHAVSVERNASPVWPRDNGPVYLQSGDGVWRVHEDAWELALSLKEIRSFQVSSDGRWLVTESGHGKNIDRANEGPLREGLHRVIALLDEESQKYERDIMLTDLESPEPSSTPIGYGWNPVFNAAGDHVYYGNYLALYAYRIASKKTSWIESAILNPYGPPLD